MDMQGKKNGKRGFTLIELIVSIFIFLIIMTAIVGIFAQQIMAYRHARVSQNDLENAQFAMNYVAKTLRTATILGEDNLDLRDPVQFGDEDFTEDFTLYEIDAQRKLVLYDFSQELCMRFSFDAGVGSYVDNALWVESKEGIAFDQIERCLDNGIYEGNGYKNERLTSGDVEGVFWIAPTRYEEVGGYRQTKTIGRVTIGMSVLPPSTNQLYDPESPIYIQTSVSLRDYPPDLSF